MEMNKDIAVMLALELNNKDLINMCLTSKTFNRYICENENFWRKKIEIDFPHIKNPKIYGKTFKKAYEKLTKKTEVNINVKIENIERELYLGNLFSFPVTNIRRLVYDGLENFFQRISLYGYYDVYIDGDSVCAAAKSLKYCFDSLDENTSEINIVLDTVEDIYAEDEDDYQRYLEESFAEYF